MAALGDYVYVYWYIGTQYADAGKVTGQEYTPQIKLLLDNGYGVLTTKPVGGGVVPSNPNPPVYLDQLKAAIASFVPVGQVDTMVATAVAAASTVQNAAALAVTAAAASSDLISGNDPRSFRPLPDSSGYVWALTDQDNRILIGIRSDGTFYAPKTEYTPDKIPASALQSDVTSRLPPQGVVASELSLSTGYVYAISDSQDRILFGIRTDGTIYGNIDRAAKAVAIDNDSANYTTEIVIDGNGDRQIYTNNKVTGNRKRVTPSGDNYDPRFGGDGTLYYDRKTNAAATASETFWVPADGSAPPRRAASTVEKIIGWGDSLTGAGAWEARLSALSGKPVTNYGVGSQTSSDIVARQGGIDPLVTVTGNQIPAASTPVTITSIVPELLYTNGTNLIANTTGSLPVTLAGVPGTLNKTATGTTRAEQSYTFTRTTPGSVVPCPPGSLLHSTLGDDLSDTAFVLWTGRNNYGGPILADTLKAIAFHKAKSKKFIVLGTTTATNEPAGSGAHTAIKNSNAALAAALGDNFIDVRADLIANAVSLLTADGITITAEDSAALAADTLPPSMMAAGDIIHFRTTPDPKTAYNRIGLLIYNRMQSKGWL